MERFKVGDFIRYDIFTSITIAGEDEKHFILKDKHGNPKKVYKDLVESHGEYMSDYMKRKVVPNDKCIDSVARVIKGALAQVNAKTRVSLTDLRCLTKAFYIDDYDSTMSSMLYIKYNSEYHLALTLLADKYGDDKKVRQEMFGDDYFSKQR